MASGSSCNVRHSARSRHRSSFGCRWSIHGYTTVARTLLPRSRLIPALLREVSVAGDRDYLEVLVELDVVLPAPIAIGVVDFKVAAALGLLFHLAARAAKGLQGGFDLLGLCRGHRGIGKREGAAH